MDDLRQQKMQKKRGLQFEPLSVIRCTEKAMNAALLIQERCTRCHNSTVREVVGSMTEAGNRYTMADLKYDLKHGRLEALPQGSDAGEIPTAKPRADAPCAGQPQPPANLDQFFQFLQCQLRMELNQHTGEDLELQDAKAFKMWPGVEAFITPNLGNTERWVPYHTILGVHELFLVQHVHSTSWSEKERFLAMFIFRAHCKRDLFTTAQLPVMSKPDFWKDPTKAFLPGGPMEKAILNYRKKTGAPLITNCFRIIPPRVLKDDDENLVRSITNRTLGLLGVADKAFPMMKDPKNSASQKMHMISELMQDAQGCGETWAKMLTVCVDLAYPSHKLLESQCDVGTGAAPVLNVLAPSEVKNGGKQHALQVLQKQVNACNSASAKEFWAVLKRQEACIRKHFSDYTLVCAQANTKERNMSAVTLQVQLCEYRQFRHSEARHKYGLPDDQTMRGEVENRSRMDPDNFIIINKKSKCISFEIPRENQKIKFELPLKAVGDDELIANSVATKCFEKVIKGASTDELRKFRDELTAGYRPGPDVPSTSDAWLNCRAHMSHACPLVTFEVKGLRCQTTAKAAGESILEAERIARLCYEKMRGGASKAKVIDYRTKLYEETVKKANSKAAAEPAEKAACKSAPTRNQSVAVSSEETVKRKLDSTKAEGSTSAKKARTTPQRTGTATGSKAPTPDPKRKSK